MAFGRLLPGHPMTRALASSDKRTHRLPSIVHGQSYSYTHSGMHLHVHSPLVQVAQSLVDPYVHVGGIKVFPSSRVSFTHYSMDDRSKRRSKCVFTLLLYLCLQNNWLGSVDLTVD
jgi:hypothetical protein